MKRRVGLFVFSIVMISVSCKKQVSDRQSGIAPVEVAEKGSWIAGINKEIASVLEEVYRNDSAYREVNAAIFSDYYIDERVLLKDVLFPENSDLYAKNVFTIPDAITGTFKRVFFEVLDKGTYPLLTKALEKERHVIVVAKPQMLADNIVIGDAGESILSGSSAVAIYFPYSLNYGSVGAGTGEAMPRIPSATIVAADRDADAAPGRQPVPCSSGAGGVCYKEVLVNDDYADMIPVHIVTIGARPKPVGVVGDAPVTNQTNRVYLGNAKLTRQMDALISFTGNGGGSEIKVARLNGYLKKENEQVTSFSGDLVTLDYSRSDIRHQRWKKVYSIWDPNWAKENLEQVFAVYEDDTKGSKTFSGSLSTTLNIPGMPAGSKAQGELAYKIEVSTQDDIITQRKMDRASFYRDGLNNQGSGFFPDAADFLAVNRDWPIYDGGTIWQYTMPWRTY